MARIIKTIEIEDQPAVALFDTGTMYKLRAFPSRTRGPQASSDSPGPREPGGQGD